MVVIKLIEGLPVLSHPRATNDQTYIGIFKTIYIYIYIYLYVLDSIGENEFLIYTKCQFGILELAFDKRWTS